MTRAYWFPLHTLAAVPKAGKITVDVTDARGFKRPMERTVTADTPAPPSAASGASAPAAKPTTPSESSSP
jgi:hypothetical protein